MTHQLAWLVCGGAIGALLTLGSGLVISSSQRRAGESGQRRGVRRLASILRLLAILAGGVFLALAISKLVRYPMPWMRL